MSLFNTPHRFPVSLLAIEHFSTVMGTLGTLDALLDTLTKYCGIPDPTDDDGAYFVSRLEEINSDDPAQPANNSTPSAQEPKRSLGTSYFTALSSLPVDRILLAAVGYDYHKAEYLYCKADRSVAMAVLETYTQLQAEQFNYLFECAMYGFGGSYKDDEKTAVPEGAIDLREVDDPVAALNMLFGNQR